MMQHLKKLCSLPGVSGREAPVREYILKALEQSPAEMTVTVDPLGSVIARIKGGNPAPKSLLLAAHMDEVGLIITGITEDGYLRFTTVGGLDARVLYARRVRVNGHLGIIGGKATHQCTKEEKETAPSVSKMLIDVGASSREEAEQLARPGDTAVFDSGYQKLEGGYFKARALDDRAGCALLLELAGRVPVYDLTLAFTVQEEVGLRGAKAVAYAVQPDYAVAVDATTAADTAGVPEDKQVCRTGRGAVVSFMDNRTLYDKKLYDTIFRLAGELDIRIQPKTMVAGGNDAGAMQLAGAGCKVAAVSLPCRYIHSGSCVLQKRDVQDTLALLQALADSLPGAEL